jgi:hypothetical protein
MSQFLLLPQLPLKIGKKMTHNDSPCFNNLNS